MKSNKKATTVKKKASTKMPKAKRSPMNKPKTYKVRSPTATAGVRG